VREFARLRQGYSEGFREQAAWQATVSGAGRTSRRSDTKLDRFAFRLTSKKTKRLAASIVSIRQALNC